MFDYMKNAEKEKEKRFHQKAAGPGIIDPGPVCVFLHNSRGTSNRIYTSYRGALCKDMPVINDPLDTDANLRRKSSKDLLLMFN